MHPCSKTAVVQVYGLQLTTIAKGAFLIRASIIFTPILSTIAGDAVPRGLWAGALLGFAGMPCITALHPSTKLCNGASEWARCLASLACPMSLSYPES